MYPNRQYAICRGRAVAGDRPALRQLHRFHRARVSFVSESLADDPGGVCILDAWEEWQAAGGAARPIQGQEVPEDD